MNPFFLLYETLHVGGVAWAVRLHPYSKPVLRFCTARSPTVGGTRSQTWSASAKNVVKL
ncbi:MULTISPECIES: hypothetical protein [unclassified Nostoc]|uniref:hypothetical protein n=1 Tax=unclassified Nostoc TaxID=2593658 RepID=UPI002AD4488A|nr:MULTISPECIES: hypothetical protein [unclassified Nostoc]MDZ8124185.1 hypothetical protein [Nostoc sp. CmiVER01]MDZ8224811.1 hypothetical protein [Nostoc sp. ChiVER01]